MAPLKHGTMKITWLAGCLVLWVGAPGRAQGTWINVWNGADSTGLVKFGSATVAYGAGVISVSGGNGYLRTAKEYAHYRTKFEWKGSGGNSGFLFHILEDRVWPLGLECQTMTGDVGSLWTTGCMFTSTGVRSGSGGTFALAGPIVTGIGTSGTGRSNFRKPGDVDPYLGDNQWNTFEMLVKLDSIEIKINNVVTMRAWKISINNGMPLVKGKIALQIEGSAVQFRAWQVMELGTTGVAPLLGTPRELVGGKRALFADPSAGAIHLLGSIHGSGLRVMDLQGRFFGVMRRSKSGPSLK